MLGYFCETSHSCNPASQADKLRTIEERTTLNAAAPISRCIRYDGLYQNQNQSKMTLNIEGMSAKPDAASKETTPTLTLTEYTLQPNDLK